MLFLEHHIGYEDALMERDWPVLLNLESMHFPTQQNDFDAGIYIFLFTYCCVFECPIVFDSDDLIRIRKQLAYWILREYLPM